MKYYRVFIEIDKGEYDYVREILPPNTSWSENSPIKNFLTLESATEEARKWNTGRVVEVNDETKRL